jgi:hypothetical protein
MHRPFPIAWLSGELAQIRDEDLRTTTQDNIPKDELGMAKPSPVVRSTLSRDVPRTLSPGDTPACIRQKSPPFAPAPVLGNHDATPADSPSPPENPIPP